MSIKPAALVAAAGLTAVIATACGGGEQRQVIQNKGSDTLVNVAQAWAEAYQKVDPNVVVAVSGGGSGTGIAALINGTVDIANSSRELKEEELRLASERGEHPVEHIVGYDALAVFLHKDNPLERLTIAQLAGIFGENGQITRWSDLGVEVPGCSDQSIIVVSRQNNSGTYEYFREAVLGEGDFRLGTRDMHGSKDVVDLVEKTPCAIGYSGMAYATDHVKMACIAATEESSCTVPSLQHATDGTYAIARSLLMYTPNEATGSVAAYLDWIKSDTGQCIIARLGYAPIRPLDCPPAG